MLSLRPTSEADLPLLLAWRYNRRVVQYFADGFETWEHHKQWFANLMPQVAESYMIILDERPVGETHIVWRDAIPDIGLYIGDLSIWGHGIGKEAISLLLANLRARYRGRVTATVHPNNFHSRMLFKAVGFKFSALSDDKYLVFEMSLQEVNGQP